MTEEKAAPKQSHGAIRHNFDPSSRSTSKIALFTLTVHPSFIPEVLSTLVSFFLTAYLRIFKDSFSSMDGGHTFE